MPAECKPLCPCCRAVRNRCVLSLKIPPRGLGWGKLNSSGGDLTNLDAFPIEQHISIHLQLNPLLLPPLSLRLSRCASLVAPLFDKFLDTGRRTRAPRHSVPPLWSRCRSSSSGLRRSVACCSKRCANCDCRSTGGKDKGGHRPDAGPRVRIGILD